METTFSNSRAALKIFDAGAVKRAAAWESVETKAEIEEAIQADADALEKLQTAFFEDTKAFNSRSNCACVDEAFIRRMVKSEPEPTAPTAPPRSAAAFLAECDRRKKQGNPPPAPDDPFWSK
jgi:hypothetical protein